MEQQSLFERADASPLAARMRPQTLDEFVGQKHLLGPGALLRRLIEGGTSANMIFYGPSGTGKTTIASIIAKRTEKALYHLNATTASLQDVKAIIADVDTMLAPNGVLLYLDEIQYFNKKQQQSLLEFMENGKITLIASTTENPYFYVYNALLSRSTVFEFKALTAEETLPAVLRALDIVRSRSPLPLTWEEEVPGLIAAGCGGDVRKAVNAVELLDRAARPVDGGLRITAADAAQASQRSAMRYDREGDEHYDLLSALQKSIRGSDPDAAVYYLGRLLEAGDLLSPCRRLLVMAAEDVGLAYPMAVPIVKACVDSALQLVLLSLVYEIVCIALPWDTVDDAWTARPRAWDAASIKGFMLELGPVSSLFDIVTFAALFFVVCPAAVGASWAELAAAGNVAGMATFAAIFQSGWFVESMWSQTLVIHMLRSPRLPSSRDHAAPALCVLTVLGLALVTWLPASPIADALGLMTLPAIFFALLIGIVAAYIALTQLAKRRYIARHGELL